MMSHNNVGRSGARAVFMALRQRARPGVDLLVDLQSCELGSESGGDLFDMCSPSGRCESKEGGGGMYPCVSISSTVFMTRLAVNKEKARRLGRGRC